MALSIDLILNHLVPIFLTTVSVKNGSKLSVRERYKGAEGFL